MKSTKHLWKRCLSVLLVLCMVGAFILPNIKVNAADTDADLWVDPVNGSDTNDGLTEATALKSIQAAKTKAAELSADGDVVVILKGGTYDATETIYFGEAESGKNGHTITYRSASGQTAIISGGKRLEGWTLHDSNNNIYVTDIPEGTELTRQFYVNGQPQRMASTEVTPTDWAMLNTTGYVSPAVSDPSSNEYLILDLGEDKMVSSVVLYAGSDRASDGNAAGFPQDFTISTSADGINWTVQVEETGFVAPIARAAAEFMFSTVGARYVKLDVTKLGNPTRNTPNEYFLSLTEMIVGLSGKETSLNLNLVQHLDLDTPVKELSGLNITTGTPSVIDLGTSAVAVGGISLTVPGLDGTRADLKIEVSADNGQTWTKVYGKTYAFKEENDIAFNTIVANKIRVTLGADATIGQLKLYGPDAISTGAAVDAPGQNADKLTDGKFDGVYTSPSYTSSIVNDSNIVINLGSVQDVGAVRLYPTYENGKPVGYLKAARILVSKDGVEYTNVLEMSNIQTPAFGAQLLLLPKGAKAQYVKIQPLLLTSAGSDYRLQLQEAEVLTTKVAVNEDNSGPVIEYHTIYNPVPLSSATPVLGYYEDVNNMTEIVDFQREDDNRPGAEAAAIIDMTTNSYGWSGLFTYDKLVAHGGVTVPAFHVDIGTSVEFNTIELAMDPDLWGTPLDFEIQAYTGTEWVTVVDADETNWSVRDHYVGHYEFESISASKIRVLVYDLTMVDGTYPDGIAENPANYRTRLILQELSVYNMVKIPYEVEVNEEADTVQYDKIPLSTSNILGYGYYRPGLETVTEHKLDSGAALFDGNLDTYSSANGQQYHWMADGGGGNYPAILLDVAASNNGLPVNINAIQLAVREDGRCAPYNYMIQVTTSATEDNWITVVEETEKDWTLNNDEMFRFPNMDIYKLRLVASNLTPQTNLPMDQATGVLITYMHIAELALYNVNDPTNPIAEDTCTQGDKASETMTHEVHLIEAKNDNPENKLNANKAIDGYVTPETENGWLVPKSYGLGDITVGNLNTIEIHSLYLWYHCINHVTSASGDGTELFGSTMGLMPTWAANSYAFIDCAGEWYIDRDELKIYYKAEGTMDDKVAILPMTERIIEMEDVENVKFDGIVFEHTSWTYPSIATYNDQQANTFYENQRWIQVPAGILLFKCINVAFDNCEIRNMGTAGIKLKSDGDGTTTGCSITNSLIHDLSFSGIIVGEVYGHHGYQHYMLVKDTTIRNNYITRVGLDMFDSPAIVACYTNGTIIDHNEIAYCPYSGISTGWGWDQDGDLAHEELGNLQVTNNLVHDTGKTNRDGGSIYNLGPSKDSKMYGNYIYNSWDGKKTYENGLYLDQGSAYWEVYNNVVGSNVGYWMHMWMATIHDNNWHDNFYVEGTKGRNDGVNNTVKDNIAVADGDFSGEPRALEIMKNAGLTDQSVKRGIWEGFAPQHDITQDFMRGNEARYIEGDWGWNNVVASSQVSKTNYDSIKKEVSIVVAPTADLTTITLTFELEDGWTCNKKSGVAHDFTNPVEFTLTNGSQTITWLVSVKNKVVSDGIIEGENVDIGSILVNSEDTDWTVKPVKRIGDTAFFNSYSGYLGQVFDVDAIFTFDMSANLDETNKDWVAISLRNQDPYTSCLNGNTEYNISINYHTIEIQKFDAGKRTILYGNHTGHTAIYGEMPNNFFYPNTRHSIMIGAVDVEEGVRLFMYVDGNLVFDFVDTDNPIRSGGHFAIYPETQMISLHAYTNQEDTPDTEALNEALSIIEGLVASDYTEESYAAVMSAMAQAQTILATAGGVTQDMVNEACNLLAAALSGLVRTDGGTGPIIKPTEPEATEPEATEPEATKPNDPDGSGKTGDEALIISFIVLMLLSVAGVITVTSLKRKAAR